MSNTYRKNYHHQVAFCGKCDKPLWQKTVQHQETCSCEWESTQVVFVNDINFPHEYSTFPLPKQRSVYRKTNTKIYDKDNYQRTRKFWQRRRNKQIRQKTKLELAKRGKEYDEMVFPVLKKQVDWDVW